MIRPNAGSGCRLYRMKKRRYRVFTLDTLSYAFFTIRGTSVLPLGVIEELYYSGQFV